jgi:hypothetical protein
MTNDFQKVTVDRIDVKVSSFETNRAPPRTGLDRARARCARVLGPRQVALRTYRGEARILTLPLTIGSAPPSATPCSCPTPRG